MRWNVRAKPEPGPAVHREPGDVLAGEHDLAGVGAQQPEQAVEERRLPAPFGPMSPTASPSSTVIETSSSAVMPENRLVMP